MKTRTALFPILVLALAAVLMVAPIRALAAESDATDILKAMSVYVGSLKSIKLTFDSDIEIITPQLEKIQFNNSGEALLSRPNKLYAHRLSGHADVAMFFDGQTVNVYEKHVNGYAQFEAQGSVDQLVQTLREGHGVALPGADLMLTNSYEVLIDEVMEAKLIGRAIIDGVACEHLAFRNFDTDWQLWVEAGEFPIPRKMIITSKTINSAPQYTIHIKSWETGVETLPSDFTFTPPANAKKLDHNALIEFDELPTSAPEGGDQ